MLNHFCKTPLWECGARLAAVACGEEPADTVIRNVTLVNVCTRELLPHTDLALSCGRVALVGNAAHCIGESTRVVDGTGLFACPGFLDGHIHVESSMMSVGEYARAVIPHGTVGIYMDPHEICNVLGLEGVRCMLEDARRTPLKTMVTVPSCVPAVPGFEDTGSAVGPGDIANTMTWNEVVGLGEMMNFPGVLACDPFVHGEIAETLRAGRTVTGHYSALETGAGLNGYIASGVRCCHESTREEDALARMRLGMYAMFREGSAWRDLKQVAASITRRQVDSRFAVLVSDDTHPRTLNRQGHLDHLIQRAVEEGIDILTAIQMVTINCAQCFQMDHELGSIAPGKCADLVLMDNLERVHVVQTYIDGELVSKNGKLVKEPAPYRYPDWATHSMHLLRPTVPKDFEVPACCEDEAAVRVIEVIPARVGTYERHMNLRIENGCIQPDVERDVLLAAVLERHHKTGKVGRGFVKGFGVRRGAMASTVAHDAHNLLVVGTNSTDMALAANTLAQCGGGMVVARDGKVLGLIPLPIAGLMNDKPAGEMARLVSSLEDAWKRIGCTMESPFMTMALISLACLPELRLTNRGLVDCTEFRFVPLCLKQDEQSGGCTG